MPQRDYLAPRDDGTIARVRVFNEFDPPLAVDCDRAFAASKELGAYNPSYHWSTRFFSGLAAFILFGSFVALIWWPWWVPIVGIVISRAMYKASQQSCADFVRDIVRDHPNGLEEMSRLGLIVASLPTNTVPER